MAIIESLENEKYISLETYRKNKQSVRTPVWFVIKENLIFVVTRDQTGKIKRLRHTQKVRVAPCTIKGKIKGDWMSGTANILNEEETKGGSKIKRQKIWIYGKDCKVSK